MKTTNYSNLLEEMTGLLNDDTAFTSCHYPTKVIGPLFGQCWSDGTRSALAKINIASRFEQVLQWNYSLVCSEYTEKRGVLVAALKYMKLLISDDWQPNLIDCFNFLEAYYPASTLFNTGALKMLPMDIVRAQFRKAYIPATRIPMDVEGNGSRAERYTAEILRVQTASTQSEKKDQRYWLNYELIGSAIAVYSVFALKLQRMWGVRVPASLSSVLPNIESYIQKDWASLTWRDYKNSTQATRELFAAEKVMHSSHFRRWRLQPDGYTPHWAVFMTVAMTMAVIDNRKAFWHQPFAGSDPTTSNSVFGALLQQNVDWEGWQI